MATDADCESALDRLTDLLAARRPGADAPAMVRVLRRFASDSRELVGLTDARGVALYCDPDAGNLVAVAFDDTGVTAASEVVSWGVHDAGAWVDLYGDDLAWVHPRYRS